jgi:cell division protein FtsI (penicillin-binding protein 3)
MGSLALAFAAVAGQLVHLAIMGQGEIRIAIAEPIARTYARPDIVDRHGRLLATDVEAHSLYADPALILDPDEVAERLAAILPEVDATELRLSLADQGRRFVWVKRGLPPAIAQRVHDLGLPGLGFRKEPRRVYPGGRLAGHVLGHVNIDNRGIAGIERWIDETFGLEAVLVARAAERPPVRLSLDLGVQHGLTQELRDAASRHRAEGAAGLVMDIATGEIRGAASLPDADPARPAEALEEARLDRVAAGSYELGSIFKLATVALALETGSATLDKLYDVRAPLRAGPHVVRDPHPQARPLTVREIFVHSSNVGAGMLAIEAGGAAQRAFLGRLGLTEPIRTEAGAVAPPRLPRRWGRAETVTIAYGHGLAVAPIQFAAAAAALLNGGRRVAPTFRAMASPQQPGERVVAAATSAALAELMRRTVTHPAGTGRRAEVSGFEVGGKTGTAEMAAAGGYVQDSVIASFVAVLPASAPRHLVLVMLHRPQPTPETKGQITAGLNAAPTAGRIIARVAPLLVTQIR